MCQFRHRLGLDGPANFALRSIIQARLANSMPAFEPSLTIGHQVVRTQAARTTDTQIIPQQVGPIAHDFIDIIYCEVILMNYLAENAGVPAGKTDVIFGCFVW